MTPREAFEQKFVSTPDLQGLSSEDIRERVVERTKLKGQLANQAQAIAFKIGDPILVRERIKLRTRHDG